MTQATNSERRSRNVRMLSYTINAVNADTVLTETTSNRQMVPIPDVLDWSMCVVEYNITALTGTSAILKVITTNDSTYNGAPGDTAVVKGDGSTAFQSGTINATGRARFTSTRRAVSGATASDLGAFFGLVLDVTSATVTGTVNVYFTC